VAISEQINLKLDRRLVEELDSLAEVLHISRSELIRSTLARAVKEDTMRMRESIALEYTRGHISDAQLELLLGPDAETIRLIKRTTLRGKKIIDDMLAAE
jgi:hypothetical protein